MSVEYPHVVKVTMDKWVRVPEAGPHAYRVGAKKEKVFPYGRKWGRTGEEAVALAKEFFAQEKERAQLKPEGGWSRAEIVKWRHSTGLTQHEEHGVFTPMAQGGVGCARCKSLKHQHAETWGQGLVCTYPPEVEGAGSRTVVIQRV